MVGPILIIKLDDASADDAIAPCGGQVAGGRFVMRCVERCVERCVGRSGVCTRILTSKT